MTMSPKSPTPSILIQNDSGSLHNFPLPLHRRPSFPHPSGMAIPRARDEGPPPPLPPPRHIGEELSRGHDIGWQFGNTHSSGPGSRPLQLASIKPGSSLLLGQGHLHNSRPQDRGLGSRKPSLPSSIEDMSLSEPSEDEHCVKTRPNIANYRSVPPQSTLVIQACAFGRACQLRPSTAVTGTARPGAFAWFMHALTA